MEQNQLNELLARVIRDIRAVGIPVSPNIDPEVAVNRRARTRFGCCRREGDRYRIELSAAVLAAEEEKICRVLAHEVLHTCRGCANHGERWKSYSRRLNEVYGWGIRRADSFEGLGVEDEREARYWVVCTACGKKIPRMKRSPLVDHPERYRCRCGGTLRVEKA